MNGRSRKWNLKKMNTGALEGVREKKAKKFQNTKHKIQTNHNYKNLQTVVLKFEFWSLGFICSLKVNF